VSRSERKYINLLTDTDRVYNRQVTNGHAVLEFSVQYMALINSRWRKITRFDNARNHGPHRHVFYPRGSQYKYPMNTQDPNQALTEAQMTIKKNFRQMRESYTMVLNRRGGGES